MCSSAVLQKAQLALYPKKEIMSPIRSPPQPFKCRKCGATGGPITEDACWFFCEDLGANALNFNAGSQASCSTSAAPADSVLESEFSAEY